MIVEVSGVSLDAGDAEPVEAAMSHCNHYGEAAMGAWGMVRQRRGFDGGLGSDECSAEGEAATDGRWRGLEGRADLGQVCVRLTRAARGLSLATSRQL